jgi:hypothetical protein
MTALLVQQSEKSRAFERMCCKFFHTPLTPSEKQALDFVDPGAICAVNGKRVRWKQEKTS